MPRFRGTGLVMLATLFKARGADVEEEFLHRLSPEGDAAYRRAAEENWVDAETQADCLAAAAAVLYPYDPEGIHRIGWEMALHNLTGVHKVAMRFMSVPALIERTADLWALYCDSGRARSGKDPEQNRGFVVVEEYPDLSEVLRKAVGGFIAGALSLTGAKHIRVTPDLRDPGAWRWDVVWE